MGGSFLLLAVACHFTFSFSSATECLYFEPMLCSSVRDLKQVSGDCILQEVSSNDAKLSEDEKGCCIDPAPNSCNCVIYGNVWHPDEKADCAPCEHDPNIHCKHSGGEHVASGQVAQVSLRDVISSSTFVMGEESSAEHRRLRILLVVIAAILVQILCL